MKLISSTRFRMFFVVALVIALVSFLGFYAVQCVTAPFVCCRTERKFDSEGWKNSPKLRLSMVKDLSASNGLIGLSKQEILRYLGSPDFKYMSPSLISSHETWDYDLNKGHNHFFSSYFRIEFSKGVVSKISEYYDQ